MGYGVQSDRVLITNLSNHIQPFIRYELTDRIIVHDEPCRCGRSTHWLEIEGRTDDILEIGGIKTAPMSLYKILEEVKAIRRFQFVQTAPDRAELHIVSDDRENAFIQARDDLLRFFEEKGAGAVDIVLSDTPPQADKVSGKFKHIMRQ